MSRNWSGRRWLYSPCHSSTGPGLRLRMGRNGSLPAGRQCQMSAGQGSLRGMALAERRVRFLPASAEPNRQAQCVTTDTDMSALTFVPIPSGELEKIRTAGVDEAGNPLVPQLDSEGGSPLRCCLRETRPGEQILLIAYTPPGTAGPYAERGPVFIHPDPCVGYQTPHFYPPALSHRQQVVRAYDHHGRIADGVLADNGATTPFR
jgi:Protein of unknown function (DUF1203)